MQSTIQDNSDLPQELCVKPLALVGVAGLDTLNNAIHKSIWETFSNNRRADRAPVLFKLIGNAHEFPAIKPKRNSYEWYIPKGILKRNWMNKHLYEIPAVIVIFYDLDWNDNLWNEKLIECASRVQSLQAALEGRNTRISVVLIQNTPPLPPGEDQLSSDRATSLCGSCELNSNSVFVLPHGDHLQGYALRLESAFYEFAQNYYHGEIKNVRAHKERLNKNIHQYLFVRHQFKLGFLCELKQDVHTAHKHYTHAYNNLLEIRIVDTNALEIRAIAGFINYKLCKLMFALNLPRDAISQFNKTHIDRFKNRMGFQELSFEHYSWLSKQFSVFGDIFDEAVKLGLPAVQTQHPGIYYQQAAQYAIIRKNSCQEWCSNIIAYPHLDPLEGASNMEFYGQRPWRRGKLSTETPDPQLESNGIQALQYLEKQVPHSNTIVALYGLAISQYKTYRCPRTRRHLVLQMADEYYNSHDFGKALTLLLHMLWDFRSENWWILLTNILEKAIVCAYLTASIQDYALLSLEILSKCSLLRAEGKNKIYENLQRILKRQIPFGDQKLSPDALQHAVIQWQPKLQKEPISLQLDLANIVTCIEIKAKFTHHRYEVDQNATVEVYIKCTSPLPLTFSKVSVTINASYNSEFPVDENNLGPASLQFQTDEVKRFVIEFMPDVNDVNKEIQIGAISLLLGSEKDVCFDLKFNPFSNLTHTPPELLHFKYCPDKVDFDNISPLATTTIIPRHSKLKVGLEHAIPALLGEWFEIKLFINNEESHCIKDMRAEVNLSRDETINLTEFSTNPSGIPEKLPLIVKLPSTLQKQEKISASVYLRAHKVIENVVELRISYTLDREKPVVSIKTETIIVPVVKPFEITTKFLSSLMEEITQFYVGEEVGVMPALRCLSPWPIVIENSSMEFSSPFRSGDTNTVSHLADTKLTNKEVGVELFLAVCEKSSDSHVTVGQYMVKWKRENGLSTTSQLTVVGCPSEWIPLELKMTAPAHGLVRTPLLVNYRFYNRSQQLIQLEVAMEASEGFMYAGYKQLNVSVLPETAKTIQYNLYPLIAGSVALPKLILTILENGEISSLSQDQLKCLVERSIPTHLFVMPQVKGTPEMTDVVKPRRIQPCKKIV